MRDPRLAHTIDTKESNFGYGDHREWPKMDRETWHRWVEREEGAPPDCDCLSEKAKDGTHDPTT